jgi:hypothetical protein
MDAEFPSLTAEQWRDVQSFFMRLRGMEGTFTYGDPRFRLPTGNVRGTPTIQVAGQTGHFLRINDFDPNITKAIAAGDFFQIGTRVYQAIEDADSDSGGNVFVDIFPRLRESPAASTPVIFKDTKILWRLSSPDFDWSTNHAGLYSISFEAVEAR